MSKFYTPQEIADLLKLDVQTIRAYIRAGKLKAAKLGREYRISEDRFKEFMEEREK